jgi:hypothetical protein
MLSAIASLLERYYTEWYLRRRFLATAATDVQVASLKAEAHRRVVALMQHDVSGRDTLLGLFEGLEKAKDNHAHRNRLIVSIHNMVVMSDDAKPSDETKRDIQAAWFKATTRQDMPLPPPPSTPPPPPPPPPSTLKHAAAAAVAVTPPDTTPRLPQPRPSPPPPSTLDQVSPSVRHLAGDLWLDFYENDEDPFFEQFETNVHYFVMQNVTRKQRAALKAFW